MWGRKGADHLIGGANSDSLAGGFGDDDLGTTDNTGGNDAANGGSSDDDVCTVDVGDTVLECEA